MPEVKFQLAIAACAHQDPVNLGKQECPEMNKEMQVIAKVSEGEGANSMDRWMESIYLSKIKH